MTVVSETLAGARADRSDWSIYLIGVGIGVLSWVVFVVANNPLGITTALWQVAGGAAMPILSSGREKHLLGKKRIPA